MSFPSNIPLEELVTSRLRAAGCVFAEGEAHLLLNAGLPPSDLAATIDRRAAGAPLEHLLGWAEFYGARMVVDAGVFVPRRRSELLVREAAAVAVPGAVVLDLCCGCGALGAALAAAVPGIDLHASDIDARAVECARANLAPSGGAVYQGDLFEPLPPRLKGTVEVLLCNAPYVPSEMIASMPPEARLHEPRRALDGGADGLDVHRRLAAEAGDWLVPGGSLIIETGSRQAPPAARLLEECGLSPRIAFSEDLEATVVIGMRSPC